MEVSAFSLIVRPLCRDIHALAESAPREYGYLNKNGLAEKLNVILGRFKEMVRIVNTETSLTDRVSNRALVEEFSRDYCAVAELLKKLSPVSSMIRGSYECVTDDVLSEVRAGWNITEEVSHPEAAGAGSVGVGGVLTFAADAAKLVRQKKESR